MSKASIIENLQHQKAENEEFVKKMRTLENIKNTGNFSEFYESGKYILFLKSDLVCLQKDDSLFLKEYKDVQDLKKSGNFKTVFLNMLPDFKSNVCLFAVNFEEATDSDIGKFENETGGKFVNIRQSLYILNRDDSHYVSHARGLFNFCKTFNFCLSCGGNLKTNEGGFKKQCEKCQKIQYPNISPVGLTLVENETHSEVLLVHQERHPPGVYTCVAGFIEPGESLEENVRREVAEEVGVYVHKVEYCTSRHWALPTCQLSLGCFATTRDKTIAIDGQEIADAKWVTAEELKDAVMRIRKIKNVSEMDEGKLWPPPSNAVSYDIMVAWLMKYHDFKLISSS